MRMEASYRYTATKGICKAFSVAILAQGKLSACLGCVCTHHSSMDDQYSASELRRRDLAGGTVADDQLSFAQVRARHGVQGAQHTDGGGGGAIINVGVFVLVAVAGIAHFLVNQK